MSTLTTPDSELVAVARGLLVGCASHVVDHCERSYQFAALAAASSGEEIDDEVLYIGALLHDVGLAPVSTGDERFEVRGANVARRALLEAGMERHRVETVWDIIALHASSPIAQHKSPETRLANRGIAIDVRGASVDDLPAEAVRAILDRWPRQDFPSRFAATMIDEVKAHPGSVRWSWMESIAVQHVPGYRQAAFLDGLHASVDFV